MRQRILEKLDQVTPEIWAKYHARVVRCLKHYAEVNFGWKNLKI